MGCEPRNAWWWLAFALALTVGVLWWDTAQAVEVVDCDEGRCVLMPVEDAAELAADLVTYRTRLQLCREGLYECEETATKAVEDCLYEVLEGGLECPPVPDCDGCQWYELVLWGVAGVGIGVIAGALLVGL